MLRSITVLVLLAVLLTGCFGSSGPSTPGTGTPPADPDELFTGEPTPAVIEVQRASAVQPATLRAVALTNDDDDAEPADDTLTAIVHLQRLTKNYVVDFQRYYTLEVPRDASSVELPVELPADKRYRVTVTVYDPYLKSDEGNYILIEIGTKQDIGVMANRVNHIPIPVQHLEYEVIAPAALYSGGDLRQIKIEVPREYGLNDVTAFYGMKPWNANGVKAFWTANAGHAGSGIPNTGWLNHGYAPTVDEPTTLYYQFRMCTPLHLEDGVHSMCAYVPDLEAGEPLAEITIYPEPDEL